MLEPAINIISTPCPLCASAERRVLEAALRDVEDRTPGDYDIAQCAACSLIYLSRRPDDRSLPLCYPPDYHAKTDRERNPVAKALFHLLRSLRMKSLNRWKTPAMNSLLEIGCGDGRFLAHLERRWEARWKFTGVDFTANTGNLPPGSKVELIEGALDSPGLQGRYDLVLAYNSLEHLSRPVDALRRLSGLLKDGALLIGQVPDWASPWRRAFPRHWSGLQVPRHLIFFDKSTLRKTLESAGFEVEEIESVFDAGDLGISVSNWSVDTLRLRARPRQAWFSLPLMILGGAVVPLQTLALKRPSALRFVARKRREAGR